MASSTPGTTAVWISPATTAQSGSGIETLPSAANAPTFSSAMTVSMPA